MKAAIPSVLLLLIVSTLSAQKITGPLSPHFQQWLQANGYASNDFIRGDLGSSGSFGGRADENQKIINQPVVFVHGNSDLALQKDAVSTYQTGWDQTAAFFMKEGYTAAELYATTWGPAQSSQALQQTYKCEYVLRIRRFIEAVLAYTNTSKIDIIGHSMGVALSRRAVKGGSECNLGAALTDRVDTFLGLAGVNYGLCTCQYAGIITTCNANDGFFPGQCGSQSICAFTLQECVQTQYATFMQNLNEDPTKEGENIFAFWSNNDEILGQGSKAFGKVTARIPNMNGSKTYNSLKHMDVKDKTGADQIKAVRDHVIDMTDLPGGGLQGNGSNLPTWSLPDLSGLISSGLAALQGGGRPENRPNLPMLNLPDIPSLFSSSLQSISDSLKNLFNGRLIL
uniref:Lipase n=1 Tax=Plectus sambesii TaxID=2011161 RepID=A0A914WTP5_9BILA